MWYIGPVILGSAPGAAAFFVTYETSKKNLQSLRKGKRYICRVISLKKMVEISLRKG